MKKLIAILILLLSPVFAYASIDNNLYYGLQNNSDVRQLQEFLIDKGYLSGNSTGNFFSLTLNAVKQYQKSQKITQSGYVGTLTRQAINAELAANLQGSNQQAVSETGTTPPTPTPPATTNDVIATLQAQIALLTQQLQAMQAQQTTTQQLQQSVQQIQQNTQQIAQNTQQTSQNICTPNWQCTSWSTCSNSNQTRTCTDQNNCGNNNGKPILTQSCSLPPTCNLVGKQVGGQGKVIWNSNGADSGELLYQHGNNAGTPFESHLWDVGKPYVINGQDMGNTVSNGWFGGISIPITIHGVFHNSTGNVDCYTTINNQTVPNPTATLVNSVSTIPLSGDYSYPNSPVIATLNIAVSDIDQPMKFMSANYDIISSDFTKGQDIGTLWFYIGNLYTGRTLTPAEQDGMTIQPGQSKNVDVKVGQDGFFPHGGTFSVHITNLIFSGKTIPVDITIPNVSVQ